MQTMTAPKIENVGCASVAAKEQHALLETVVIGQELQVIEGCGTR
jgi:hypothetical protein